MYLENPTRATERDNQNSLRKYPFADTALCGNGSCVIPSGAIIDALLYIPGRAAGRVWLSEIDNDGKLHFADNAGEFAVTSQPLQPLSAIPVTFTGDGGTLPGGVVVCGKEADVLALLRAGRQSFDQAQTELAPVAVVFTGSRGVTGFKLDDGNVVWGAVKIRGANGCDVATYVTDDGVRHLRISAIGRSVTDTTVTGFIKQVVAESDNSNFTVTPLRLESGEVTPNRCICITPNGASYLGDADIPYDQDDACAAVKKFRGTLPSGSATVPPDCGKGICADPSYAYHTVTLMNGDVEVARITMYEGQAVAPILPDELPTRGGKRFSGYYDSQEEEPGKQYYRADGTPAVKVFSNETDVVLHAHWIPATSTATATFSGYGTLHLLAPDTDMPKYVNPLRISGGPGLVPSVRTMTPSELAEGGSDAVSDLILHPATASGEVRLSLRGLDKAFDS